MQDRSRLSVMAAGALLLAGCTVQVVPSSPRTEPESLQAIYERSIAAAAVGSVSAEKPLWPITEDEVTVAHLQSAPKINSERPVWVARVEELRPFCKGKPVPLLALQMALGLPPESGDEVKVFTFTVRRIDLFRPCASSQEPEALSCKIDVDHAPSAQNAEGHFILKQMMGSYRVKGGYPFTAMGWSYNWDPTAPSPQGISEYVLKPGSVRRSETSVSPARFCAG